MSRSRITRRIGTGTLLLVVAAATLSGCVTSEKSRYGRHLSALVPQRPVRDADASFALRPRDGDEGSLRGPSEEPVPGP